jgi:hypothetical protein
MKLKFKMPKISRRTGKKIAKVGAVVVTLAQVTLKEIERNTSKIK